MASPSLTYEILMYLNSFYFGMFSACEFGIGILKAVNLDYEKNILYKELCLLVGMIIIESIRIYFGRHGSLSDRGWKIFSSVLLTVPSSAAVGYLLFIQQHRLRLETILCGLMLSLQLSEIIVAFLFLVTMCRPKSYI